MDVDEGKLDDELDEIDEDVDSLDLARMLSRNDELELEGEEVEGKGAGGCDGNGECKGMIGPFSTSESSDSLSSGPPGEVSRRGTWKFDSIQTTYTTCERMSS